LFFFPILAEQYEEKNPFLDSTGCNKMIMIVTDGATETALNVFQTRNWTPNNVSTCHPIEVEREKKLKDFFEMKFYSQSRLVCLRI